MIDIYEAFEQIGLTKNEVTIYKYLLRKGMSAGRQIYEENSLDKSSSYRAISELQEKGLVYAIGETRNQKFAAHSGEAVVALYNKVQLELDTAKKGITSFLDDVSKYAKEHYKSSRISLYEGAAGYKLFYSQRLQGAVNEIKQFGPWAEQSKIIPDYYDFMGGFIKKRVERGIKLKALYDNSVVPDRFGKSEDSLLKEVRKLDTDMRLRAMLVIHGDSVSINTKEDGKFLGLVIKDRLISDLLEKMFDYMWDKASSV